MTEVDTLAVVGGGFMGSGIAESAARAGIHVLVHEPDQGPLDRSRERIERSIARGVRSGKLSDDDAQGMSERVTWTTDAGEIGGAQVLVEAIVEDLDVKAKLFERLDDMVPDACIVASNTSSIPIAQLASMTDRPDRVCGLHFFSPVPVMGLVEVVVGLDTAEQTVDDADALARKLGKTPVHTQDRSGFIVNFLLVPYLMAAVRMYQDGFATAEDIDDGMKLGCGHPMGPLTLSDFIGLDVLYAIGNSLFDEFKQPEYAPPPLLKRMVAAGRLGRKSGHGFYEYANGS